MSNLTSLTDDVLDYAIATALEAARSADAQLTKIAVEKLRRTVATDFPAARFLTCTAEGDQATLVPDTIESEDETVLLSSAVLAAWVEARPVIAQALELLPQRARQGDTVIIDLANADVHVTFR